jgi:hypothetical protein
MVAQVLVALHLWEVVASVAVPNTTSTASSCHFIFMQAEEALELGAMEFVSK